MNQHSIDHKVRSVVGQLKEEDLIPALYLMEMYLERVRFDDFQHELNVNVLNNFSRTLNSIKELGEIRTLVVNTFSKASEVYCEDFIKEIDRFKTVTTNRGLDIIPFKKDKRLLNFALTELTQNRHYNYSREIKKINNPFYRFLFIIYCHPAIYKYNYIVEDINANYSSILSRNPTYFPNYDTPEFYRWAKKYMDKESKYDSVEYHPLTDEDFKITIESIFDALSVKDEIIYSALKKKISNAWYQTEYREKHKGKKDFYFPLTKNAQEALQKLAFKFGISEVHVVERLINESYVKECLDTSGKPRY